MCIRDYIRRKTTRVASQVSEVTNEQQQTLMPTVINENEPQYLPVREIGEKLDTDNLIRNIALTGPYGSGKVPYFIRYNRIIKSIPTYKFHLQRLNRMIFWNATRKRKIKRHRATQSSH